MVVFLGREPIDSELNVSAQGQLESLVLAIPVGLNAYPELLELIEFVVNTLGLNQAFRGRQSGGRFLEPIPALFKSNQLIAQ